MVKDRFKCGFKKLLQLIGQSTVINIPLMNNIDQYTSYNVMGLISKIKVDELGKTNLITLDTLICKYLIEDCPTINLQKKNASITYKNNSYSIAIEEVNAFDNVIILYLNRKS